MRLNLIDNGCPYPERVRDILEAAGHQIVSTRADDDVLAVWANSPRHRTMLRKDVQARPHYVLYYAPICSFRAPPYGPGPIGLSIVPGAGEVPHFDAPRSHQGGNGIDGRAEQARAGIARLQSDRLTRFNEFPAIGPEALKVPAHTPIVVVADQCADAHDVMSAEDARRRARKMLDAAVAENPDATVVVKRHPDAVSRRRTPLLDEAACSRAGAVLLDEAVEPWGMIERARSLYTLTSDMGLEALFAGLPVHCFGVPFYARRGLTHDRNGAGEASTNAKPAVLEELFGEAYLERTLYYDPIARRPCEFEEAADMMSRWRRVNERNAANHICVGVKWWNRRPVRQLLQSTRGTVRFASRPSRAASLAARRGGRVVVWSSRETEALRESCRQRNVPLLRVEDGFLRSVGLGAHYVPASSLVLDSRGIYYDPRQTSDLEWLIEHAEFSEELRERARRLRRRVVGARLSKYNVGEDGPLVTLPKDRKTILVPGQVEDDASIRYGTAEVSSNLHLLKAARGAEPDAYIVYKGHPDVELGGRPGRLSPSEALQYADQVVGNVPIPGILESVDEVHTMTSLVGFEALMREKGVIVYGMPFYAGWGVTRDRVPLPRRNRRLTLDELVAAVLLLYAEYLDLASGLPCSAEALLNRLEEGTDAYERNLPLAHRLMMRFRRSLARAAT